MNVCMFTNTYLPHVGGVAKSVALFAEDLIRLGHDVLVVAPTFADDVREERPEEIQRVPAIQNFNGSDFSARIALPFVISNKINAFKPDIVHSHHPYLLGDAGLRAARRQGVPLVFTHHTRYEEYTHYVSLDSEQMKNFVIRLSTEYANLCDGVVAPSRSIQTIIQERGVDVPIEEIPTGVDVDFFQKGDGARARGELEISEQTPVIGHVGRLAPEKNLAFLASAVSRYLEKNPGVFLVVGEGESEEGIRETFRKNGQDDRLIMAGVKSGPALADVYDAMDLFVFASKSETQGMVLIEAMAAKTPVIALDASGVREVVADGQNGRLLPADASASDFADAVKYFYGKGENADAVRKNAFRTAVRFSRENCAKKLAAYYGETMEKYDHGKHESNGFDLWDKLLRSISAEWDLINQKTSALVDTISNDA